MTKDDITKWAREAGLIDPMVFYAGYERFASLVAAAERERIIAKNVPEIEKINTHIKALEEALLAERKAWAGLLDSRKTNANSLIDAVRNVEAAAIRARGTT